MQTSIALSIPKIIENIMAHSAMRHILDPQRPPLLTPDHRPALELFIEEVLSSLAMTLRAGLKSDDDITVLAFELPEENSPSAIRAAIEFAVASAVLSQAYRGTDRAYSDACRTDYDVALTSLRSVMSRSATILPCIF